MPVIRIAKRNGATWKPHRDGGRLVILGTPCRSVDCIAPTTVGRATYPSESGKKVAADLCFECGPKWCSENGLEYE